MQRKLQFHSKLRSFVIELLSFCERTIKHDKSNEISKDYA
jgi:hypothetical protein